MTVAFLTIWVAPIHLARINLQLVSHYKQLAEAAYCVVVMDCAFYSRRWCYPTTYCNAFCSMIFCNWLCEEAYFTTSRIRLWKWVMFWYTEQKLQSQLLRCSANLKTSVQNHNHATCIKNELHSGALVHVQTQTDLQCHTNLPLRALSPFPHRKEVDCSRGSSFLSMAPYTICTTWWRTNYSQICINQMHEPKEINHVYKVENL